MLIDRTTKEYTLSDGSVWTALLLANELNITKSGARYRLKQSSDFDDVMRKNNQNLGRPPNDRIVSNNKKFVSISKQPKAVRADILTRNAYDPMGKLFLKMS